MAIDYGFLNYISESNLTHTWIKKNVKATIKVYHDVSNFKLMFPLKLESWMKEVENRLFKGADKGKGGQMNERTI